MMNEITLKYNNVFFRVNRHELSINSRKLRNIENSYEFKEDNFVSNDSFLTFLSALSGGQYTINCSNVYELKYLSNKWGFDRLKDEIKFFLKCCNSHELNLSKLLYRNRFNKSTKEIVRVISMNFDQYLKFKKINCIDYESFNRIITFPSFKCTDQIGLKDYIFHRYQDDPKFSSFFNYIDSSLFTENERNILRSDPSVDIKMNESPTFGQLIKEQQKQLHQLQQKFHELSVSQNSNDYVSYRLKKLNKEFNAILSQKETQQEMQLPMEGFMESLNKIKESLEGIDIQTQDLEYKFGQALRFAERNQ